jgi:uncharacterized protein (DUF1800 family)
MNARALGSFLAVSIAVSAVLATTAAATFPDDEKTIVHVLNRIGFGARPGDVERVRQLGLQRYLDDQLHPERLPDAGMASRLAHLKTLELTSREISEQFEQPMLEARRERRQQAANGSAPDAERAMPPIVQQQANGVLVELSEQKMLRAIYSERQLQEVLTDFWFNHFNVDARKGRDRFLLTEYEREAIRPHVLGRFRDLLGATAESPAMLFYLDNWLSADPNGPHAPAGRRPMAAPRAGIGRRPPGPLRPGAVRPGAVRPGARPNPDGTGQAGAPIDPQQRNRRNGLNENYARELMELHTLGVDGGYTQKDVTEVARAFTGWTIDGPRQGARFRFETRIHDDGEKTILGHRIKSGGGKSDGDQVLDILAAHPSTARFIATKLARRFVGDTPPSALIDRLAARFSASHGDLRAVMTALLTSPDFLSPDSYRAKVKSPFEFLVSAVRATGAEIGDARPFVRSLQDLGMPLYQCQPPTGYKDTADAWTNTGALVNRMNFALAFASGNIRAGDSRGPERAALRDRAGDSRGHERAALRDNASWQPAIESALAHDISETTRATIAKGSSAAERAALTLGSPEFQRK